MTEKNEETIASLNGQLPIGVGPSLNKTLALREMRTLDERQIEKRARKHKKSMGRYVTTVLSQMITQLGEYDFDEIDKPALKDIRIGQLRAGDVFAAYLLLRIDTIGDKVSFKPTCGSCDKKFAFEGDLNSVAVRTANSEEEMKWAYDLRHPIKIRGRTVTRFNCKPIVWSKVCELPLNVTERLAKICLSQGSVCGFNDEDGEEITLLDKEIDELSKFDLEGLATSTDDNTVGPKMALEGVCPHCEEEFKIPINWGYDSFFSNSSQS